MSPTGLTLPGIPSLIYLAFLFGYLPWAAARSGRRLHGAGADAAGREGKEGTEDKQARAVHSRTALWGGTLLSEVFIFVLATIVGLTFGYHAFAWAAPAPLHAVYAAGALALCLALRAVRRAIRTEEEKRGMLVHAIAPRTSVELVLWTCTVLAASVAEEVAYRGVAMQILWYALGNPWIAAFLCAVAFALAHAAQKTRSMVIVFAIALVMHALVALTGSLVPAMIVHALYDFIAGLAIRREAMARAVTAGVVVALLAGGAVATGDAAPVRPPMPADLPTTAAPDSFRVVFETTKGPVVALARRAWSPLAVDRLYHLVNAGFYDGTVIFRVGPTASYEGGFVVQFGITNDGAVNAAWDTTGVPDEPVIEGHRRGRLYFARGGPDTRSTQLAIDLTANTPLDTVSYQGVVGFPAIGEITSGLAALDSLERRYGNTIFEHWDSVATQGRAFLDRKYPGLDRIERAHVEKTGR